uniref:PTS sugar transporter subunit IIC n=1 Tax=Parolsenella massiliensis TaxID=1871022 RepID=UPI0009328DD3|nr:PTS transporter subunit EIIC [Parolsenella massiliensis]
MALENMFESPIIQKLQALGAKSQSSPTLSTISSGMMTTLSIIMAGAVFTIVSSILNITGLIGTDSALYQWLQLPYNMTIGVMSLIIAFALGYQYTKALKMKGELANGIVTLVLFMMVCSPIKSVTLQDGTTASVLDSTYLGGSGMFTAIIVSLIAVRIIKLCQDKHIVLTMPDSVPQYLADSFSAVIPLVINIVLWTGLNTLCETFMGAALPGVIMGILAMPLAGLNSVPGMFIVALVGLLCWCLGIHGTGVIMIVLMPVFMQYYADNAAAHAAGVAMTLQPVALYFLAQCGGGSGNMFPLAALCCRAKSEQLKAIGKVGLVPSIFNISEPMIFGVPVMYNPLIAIPFILNTLISMLVIYLLYVVGFFQPQYIMIMSSLPIFMADYLTSMAWQNLFIPVICIVVGFITYLPFVKLYDKQLCEQEAANSAAEQA